MWTRSVEICFCSYLLSKMNQLLRYSQPILATQPIVTFLKLTIKKHKNKVWKMSSMLTMNIFRTLFWCFYCWLWAGGCRPTLLIRRHFNNLKLWLHNTKNIFLPRCMQYTKRVMKLKADAFHAVRLSDIIPVFLSIIFGVNLGYCFRETNFWFLTPICSIVSGGFPSVL